MQVENPYQIPASIDAVQNDQYAIFALDSLKKFMHSFFVQDHAPTYWIYVMSVVGFVFLCAIVGWGLLIACMFKKRVTLVTICKIPRSKISIGLPNSTCFTAFFASVSAAWFILFAVHQFRLDLQLNWRELNASIDWLCIICAPFWLTLYVQAIEFCDLPLLKAPNDWMQNIKVVGILTRILLWICAFTFPVFAVLASATAGYKYQQDYEHIVTEVEQYFSDSNMSHLINFELNSSSVGAMTVLQRYKTEAISLWKRLASVYNNTETIMLIWASYFGLLLALYLYGTFRIYMRRKNCNKNISNISAIATKLEENMTSVNEEYAGYANIQFLQKYKHIFSAMACIVFFIIFSFQTVRLTSLVKMAQIAQFVGIYLIILSTLMLLSSAYTIVHLSITYANESQPSNTPAQI